MIKRLGSLRIPAGIYYYSVCFIFLINLSSANIHHSNSSDDENVVNSDGMWQKEAQTMEPPKLSQGASRFDVGGILTTFGMKQGGSSLFALVMLPILFPLMVLMAIALFVISVFGSSGLGLAVAGRRYGAAGDDAMSIISHSGGGASWFPRPTGYKTVIDRDGFPITMLTNRDGLAFDVLQNGNDDDKDACIERFVCEILVHGGIGKVLGKKATLQLLRGLNVKPTIITNTNVLPNSSPGRKPRKVWKCSSLNCDWEKWGPWTEDARGAFTNYIGS